VLLPFVAPTTIFLSGLNVNAPLTGEIVAISLPALTSQILVLLTSLVLTETSSPSGLKLSKSGVESDVNPD
jgi:hypothetical protein